VEDVVTVGMHVAIRMCGLLLYPLSCSWVWIWDENISCINICMYCVRVWIDIRQKGSRLNERSLKEWNFMNNVHQINSIFHERILE
jgi:hypothetical protein